MSSDHNGDLSPDARSYISSLRESAEREVAREYARMDDQSFRARIGPGLDNLEKKVDAILGEIRRRPRVSRKALLGAAALGGALATRYGDIIDVLRAIP